MRKNKRYDPKQKTEKQTLKLIINKIANNDNKKGTKNCKQKEFFNFE